MKRKFEGHLEGGGKRTIPWRGMRQHRHARFSHSTIVRMDEELQNTKKRKAHEAQLIPGVDGKVIFGFPRTIITKLRYCDYGKITASSGARALNIFSANGIYDPDITGVGHQPLYRDQWAAIYSHYVVIGSKITVTFNSNQTTNQLVGIRGEDDSTVTSTVTTLMEGNNSVWAIVSQNAGGHNQKTLTMTFEPNENIGVDAKSDGYSTVPVGQNANEAWNYAVWCAAVDGSSTSEVEYAVEIDYTIKLAELADISQS